MGVIFDIKRFAVHDGPGIRTTVFLKGCPLRCVACHNPESQSFDSERLFRPERCLRCGACLEACPSGALTARNGSVACDRDACRLCFACAEACLAGAAERIGREASVEAVLDEVARDRVFYEESGGGVTFSGGEPLAQPEFLEELLLACRAARLHTAVDTSGFAAFEVFERILPAVDLFLFDLKSACEGSHERLTGVPFQPILENLRRLAARGAGLLLRVPLLPGWNDTTEELSALGAAAASLPGPPPLEILPFHRAGLHKYERLGRPPSLLEGAAPPSRKAAREAQRTLRSFGLRVLPEEEDHDAER